MKSEGGREDGWWTLEVTREKSGEWGGDGVGERRGERGGEIEEGREERRMRGEWKRRVGKGKGW